jgi:hypothetical protein
MHARLGGTRQAGIRHQRGPSWLSVLPDLAPGAIWELPDSGADDDDDE